MAIEPTSLSDILTTPDVPLEPVGNVSGQGFSEFFSALTVDAASDDGTPTVAVGNPTPEASEADEVAVPATDAAEGPVHALLLIAEKLGLTGKGKDEPTEVKTGELTEPPPEAALPPGLAGKAKAYGLTHATPPKARRPLLSEEKIEKADESKTVKADAADSRENGDQPAAVATDVAQTATTPVILPAVPVNPTVTADETIAHEKAYAVITPPSTPEFASRPTEASCITDEPSPDLASAKLDEMKPAKQDALFTAKEIAGDELPNGIASMPIAKAEKLKTDASAHADTMSADDLQTPQPTPSVPAPGQLHAALSQVAASPPVSVSVSVPAQALDHQHVLEDLLVGNSVEDQWVDRLSHDVQTLISSDNREARLHLRPRELGDLSIKVEMKDGQAKVHFTVETAAAQSFIADATPRLQTMMENRGFRLDQASVDVGGNGAGKGGTAGHGQQDAQPFMAKAPPSVLAAVASRVAKLTAFERYA